MSSNENLKNLSKLALKGMVGGALALGMAASATPTASLNSAAPSAQARHSCGAPSSCGIIVNSCGLTSQSSCGLIGNSCGMQAELNSCGIIVNSCGATATARQTEDGVSEFEALKAKLSKA